MDNLQLLEAMVRTTSYSGHEQHMAELLCTEMRERGFTARVDEVGNAIGEIGESGTGPTIVLLGHMDTVQGVVPVRQEGDLLYGRGAVDAKGPLATFISAATNFRGCAKVVVVGAVEEEAATSRGARHIVNTLEPDFVVIGEPSNWDRITVGYKGRMLANYHTERTMAHTAAAQSSACETAFGFWQAVQDATDELNASRSSAIFDRLQPSLRAMRSASDGLIETAELDLGFRLPTNFDLPRWEEQLRLLAGSSSIRFFAQEQAVRVDKNTALARALLAGIRGEGGVPRFVVKTGTSDLNVVAARWRCPMVAYGPGDSAYDHTPDEHISVSEYQRSIQVLGTALAALAPLSTRDPQLLIT